MVRRRALQVIGVALASASGVGMLAGCKKSGSEGAASGATGASAGAGGSCEAKIPGDETATNLRRTLQYKEQSDTPDKKCTTCAQFESDRYAGMGCGGCKLFGGAVNPDGVCLSFAPRQAPGAAGAAPPAAAPGKAG